MALTYIALAGLVFVAILLRLLVPRCSPLLRRRLCLLLALLLIPALLNTISRWETTSLHLNASLFWIRLFAYELCIAFFSLVQPRAFTAVIAAILTLPLFSSSVVGPASALFSHAEPLIRSAGGDYFLELLPWSSGLHQNGGADFALFYQPAGVHFLRRSFMGARLYDSQCRTADTAATINPATHHITVHCPPLSADPAAPPSGTELDYLIPRGALSPALAHAQHR